jgi:aryl-alcohol dehydrogenase-like predicted oxidoreductase
MDMERRRLGQFEVSVVGLGTNSLGTTFFGSGVDIDGTRAVIDAAIDAGVNFIDTAAVYGESEVFLGQALGGRRDEVILATKFGMGGEGAGAASIAKAVESSLTRLRTDRIDVYQLHTPDANTPIDETLTALDQLVTDGKVLEIGCSNFSTEQLEEAAGASASNGLARFVSVQNNLSVLAPAGAAVLAACERLDVAYIPFSPLAGGMLTGKYKRGQAPAEGTRLASVPGQGAHSSLSDANFDRVDKLEAFAAEHGHSLIELAFAWLLAQPKVASIISGATRPEQVRANVAAAGWTLTAEEAAQAAALVTG